MGCAPARYCSRRTFFVWVWCWQWPEIFGVAYDPSPPPPQSIRLFFLLNLWYSHRKGVNKQKMQPLHTVNSHVVIVMISSCLCKKAHGPQTWHLMVLPPLKAFSSWEAHKQTHLKSSSWPWLEEGLERDCVLEDDYKTTCQSWQLRILARCLPPTCSALVRLRIASDAEDLHSLALNTATEERLHAYGDRLPHPISLVHIVISWVLSLYVSTCHY